MENLSTYIEHTLLKQDATKNEIKTLIEEAKTYSFKGICINPCFISYAKELLRGTDIKLVTVVGFPLGANHTEVKAFETTKAIEDGADEIDMVINVSAIKDKDFDYVKNDISAVKKACKDKVLKVILETDLLEKEEIKKACELCADASADFVKTSTGFVKNGIGATAEDVKLMNETVAPKGLRVEASAGIRDKAKALEMIEAGASRLGTSSGAAIVS